MILTIKRDAIMHGDIYILHYCTPFIHIEEMGFVWVPGNLKPESKKSGLKKKNLNNP